MICIYERDILHIISSWWLDNPDDLMIQKSEVITGSTFLRSHKKRVQDPASGNDRCLPSSIFQGLIRYDLLHIYYPPKTEWMDTKNDRHWKMCRLSNIVIWVCKNSGGYVVSERTQWSDTPFFCWSKMCTYRWSWLILRVWILKDKESRTSTRQVSRVFPTLVGCFIWRMILPTYTGIIFSAMK